MSNARYALWAEDIGKSFRKTAVLKSASLWAEPGKVTTLMGRNGSGKTTLIKIAVGVLRSDHGVVSFLGDARRRHSLPRLARLGLMYVPQGQLVVRAHTVRSHFGALEEVFGPDGISEAISEARVDELLDRRADSLSGGERVRVSLALALARRPTVLVIDEPLVGLSPRDQEALAELLRGIASSGAAVVTSGHDTRVLMSISDLIIWSVAGTTHHLDSPAEAHAHAQFQREYLGRKTDYV